MDHILTFRFQVSHSSQLYNYKLYYCFLKSTYKRLKQLSFQVVVFEDPVALEQYIICKLLAYYLWEIEEKKTTMETSEYLFFFFFLVTVVKVMNFRIWRAEGRESLFFFFCFFSESFFSRSNLRTLSWSFNKTKYIVLWLYIYNKKTSSNKATIVLCFYKLYRSQNCITSTTY